MIVIYKHFFEIVSVVKKVWRLVPFFIQSWGYMRNMHMPHTAVMDHLWIVSVTGPIPTATNSMHAWMEVLATFHHALSIYDL